MEGASTNSGREGSGKRGDEWRYARGTSTTRAELGRREGREDDWSNARMLGELRERRRARRGNLTSCGSCLLGSGKDRTETAMTRRGWAVRCPGQTLVGHVQARSSHCAGRNARPTSPPWDRAASSLSLIPSSTIELWSYRTSGEVPTAEQARSAGARARNRGVSNARGRTGPRWQVARRGASLRGATGLNVSPPLLHVLFGGREWARWFRRHRADSEGSESEWEL